MFNISFPVIAVLLLSANYLNVFQTCTQPASTPDAESSTSVLPYQLGSPAASFELPKVLDEISGLSLTSDGGQLVSVNDEDGVLYLLSKEEGIIEKQIRFWDHGDYEGVEIIGDDAYIVKSNGIIYRVENYGTENRKTFRLNTTLTKTDNVEGLGYDAPNHRLLIACKGDTYSGKHPSPRRKIYAFDLKSMQLSSLPVFIISSEMAVRHLKQSGKDSKELLSGFSPEMKFSPSGIAVHPISGDLYVISATAKMLMVLSSEGNIINVVKLNRDIHEQPEGICFDSEGTLFISNEGNGGTAKIYKYVYRN